MYLYGIEGGANVTFSPAATHEHAFTDAAFSTAWSSDGMSYAVASQDGCVKVWDVRSSIPLTELRGVENSRRRRPVPKPVVSSSNGRRGWAVPPGMDPPLADGSQYMPISPPAPLPLSSLFGLPTSSHYYGYSHLDGGGHFGTPGPISGATMVPSDASIPDREMELVIPGVRSLKFVKSGGREVLAFAEVMFKLHLNRILPLCCAAFLSSLFTASKSCAPCRCPDIQ